MLAKRFEGRGVDETTRYLVKRDLERRSIEYGNTLIEHLRARRRASTWHRAASFARLGYLSLLVVIWL